MGPMGPSGRGDDHGRHRWIKDTQGNHETVLGRVARSTEWEGSQPSSAGPLKECCFLFRSFLFVYP